MLENLFESIDKRVLTEELQECITNEFNDAVQIKATELAENEIEATQNKLRAEAKKYMRQLDEAFDEYASYYDENLTNKLNSYLDYIVQELVESNTQALQQVVDEKRARVLEKIFEKSAAVLGSSLSELYEDNSVMSKLDDVKNELENAKSQINRYMNENIELKRDVFTVSLASLCAELSESLTLPQQTAFKSMVEMQESALAAEFEKNMDLQQLHESLKKIADNLITLGSSRACCPAPEFVAPEKQVKSLRESENRTEKDVSWRRFV